MSRFFSWIKNNKLATVLLIFLAVLVYFQVSNNRDRQVSYQGEMMGVSAPAGTAMYDMGGVNTANSFSKMMPVFSEAAPSPDVANRMVVSDSYLSLVVKDVSTSVKESVEYAQSIGGYMVQSNISRPEEGGTGTVILRIPTAKLPEALIALKGKAVSVVSENLEGTDVTDQYVDNAEKLRILESNKTRFEQLMTSAADIDDILRVQQEIFALQSQIDSIKGSQNYLEKTSEMAKITLYMSTDELALPYAPTDTWRPEVIFKTAVRSLVSSIRDLGTLLIWTAVYAIIWIPLLIVGWLIYHFSTRKRTKISN